MVRRQPSSAIQDPIACLASSMASRWGSSPKPSLTWKNGAFHSHLPFLETPRSLYSQWFALPGNTLGSLFTVICPSGKPWRVRFTVNRALLISRRPRFTVNPGTLRFSRARLTVNPRVLRFPRARLTVNPRPRRRGEISRSPPRRPIPRATLRQVPRRDGVDRSSSVLRRRLPRRLLRQSRAVLPGAP